MSRLTPWWAAALLTVPQTRDCDIRRANAAASCCTSVEQFLRYPHWLVNIGVQCGDRSAAKTV